MTKQNEQKRLNILKEYKVLDSLPEKEFDEIAELASFICQMPISMISLIDSKRQWFKSKVGLGISETPKEDSICYHAIQNPEEIMVVTDTEKDERFKNNRYVTGKPNFRFYAGAPLVSSDGVAIGTLCVLDSKKRELSVDQLRALRILANRAMAQLELRKNNLNQKNNLDQLGSRLKAILEQSPDYILTIDRDFRITYINRTDYNVKKRDIMGINAFSFVHPDDKKEYEQKLRSSFESGKQSQLVLKSLLPGGKRVWFQGRISPLKDSSGGINEMLVISTDITEKKNSEEKDILYTQTLEKMMFDISHKIRRPVSSCLGLIQMLDKKKSEGAEFLQIMNYFRVSATELDRVTREMSDFIEKNNKVTLKPK